MNTLIGPETETLTRRHDPGRVLPPRAGQAVPHAATNQLTEEGTESFEELFADEAAEGMEQPLLATDAEAEEAEAEELRGRRRTSRSASLFPAPNRTSHAKGKRGTAPLCLQFHVTSPPDWTHQLRACSVQGRGWVTRLRWRILGCKEAL